MALYNPLEGLAEPSRFGQTSHDCRFQVAHAWYSLHGLREGNAMPPARRRFDCGGLGGSQHACFLFEGRKTIHPGRQIDYLILFNRICLILLDFFLYSSFIFFPDMFPHFSSRNLLKPPLNSPEQPLKYPSTLP